MSLRGVLWNPAVSDIGSLGGADGLRTIARAMNNLGQIVGSSQKVSGGSDRPFFWQNGVMSELIPAPDGSLIPLRINDRGTILGLGGEPGAPFTGYVTRAGATPARLMPDVATTAFGGLNDLDWITGSYSDAAGTRAFIYRNGRRIELGTLAGQTFSFGNSINNHGEVVGQDGFTTPLLFCGGVVHDLRTWVQNYPVDAVPYHINDDGIITIRTESPERSWLLSPNYRVTAAPLLPMPGEIVTVHWKAPAGRPATDWIGLY